MFYECLSDKSLIVVYHVDGENEARVSCIFCQWFMDVYGKLQCLSMVNREARVSCNAPWLLRLCSRSSTDTRGRDWASSCRTSWIRTSSILPKKNVYFSVRNLSNKLQEGRQVMASPAKWCQRHPVKLPEGHALWPKKMSVQLNLALELPQVISCHIHVDQYSNLHMVSHDFSEFPYNRLGFLIAMFGDV